mmetsp:Transcript_121532/g.288900  ORF Transcript_121532/g.288900 Transcript_121532/m.288900 type:complete len:219 (-) Transcript_121532:741-1397(-)
MCLPSPVRSSSMALMIEFCPPISPSRVASTICSTCSCMFDFASLYFACNLPAALKKGRCRFHPYSEEALMLPVDTPRPILKLSTNLCGGCLAPSRSTLRMSKPMLQVTTASAVMAVSQSLTPSTRWPARKCDHSRMKARVFAKICGAKFLILIWLKPLGRRLWAAFQSSEVSLLVNKPFSVKSCNPICARLFHNLGKSGARAMSSSTMLALAVKIVTV